MSSQANLTISGIISILLKEKVRQGESGLSNLVGREILYIRKPSFQKNFFCTT